MEKKIAIVTGATGGIGSSICRTLGEEGYVVIMNGIDPEAGSAAKAELERVGIECDYLNFSVADEESVNSNVRAIGDRYGHIDVLVNNAGGLGGRSRFENMTTEFYRKVMALNLDSVFYMSRACIPYLKKTSGSSIVNFASNAAWNAGGPGAGIYGTSKGGVVLMTRALAKDLAEYGIRVNAQDTVRDMVLKNSTVKTKVMAVIRNAEIIETIYKDGLCQVNMELKLDGKRWYRILTGENF